MNWTEIDLAMIAFLLLEKYESVSSKENICFLVSTWLELRGMAKGFLGNANCLCC